jgi:hypothetical protein
MISELSNNTVCVHTLKQPLLGRDLRETIVELRIVFEGRSWRLSVQCEWPYVDEEAEVAFLQPHLLCIVDWLRANAERGNTLLYPFRQLVVAAQRNPARRRNCGVQVRDTFVAEVLKVPDIGEAQDSNPVIFAKRATFPTLPEQILISIAARI